jgi:type IV pilus assembly protein PilC
MTIKRKFSLKEESDMLRKLHLYTAANISLVDAIGMIAEQQTSRPKRETVLDWQRGVSEGKMLADISRNANACRVSDIFTDALRLGERSGAFSESCKNTHERLEKIIGIRKKIVGAVTYPAVIMVGTLGLVVGLMVFVFPKIIPLFETLKLDLPWSTKFLILCSRFLAEHWSVVFGFLSAAFVFLPLLIKKFPITKFVLQELIIRTPIFGKVVRASIVLSVFDSTYALIHGGDQVSEAIGGVADSCRFVSYKRFLIETRRAAIEGKSLGEIFKNNQKLFPAYVSGLVLVGEKTGNLELAFKNVSEISKEELEDRLRLITASIEPILMVSMSLIIGFIALSIILPIYGITTHFQSV